MRRSQGNRLSERDAADFVLIGKIADRAVSVYNKFGVHVDRRDVLMDVTTCHFSCHCLRLEELLDADEFNLIHDIGGIDRHLDHSKRVLRDGWTPRYGVPRSARPVPLPEALSDLSRKVKK